MVTYTVMTKYFCTDFFHTIYPLQCCIYTSYWINPYDKVNVNKTMIAPILYIVNI